MGQKVNPIGLRIGINHDWSSHWYANKKEFAKYLEQDHKIRSYFASRIEESMLSHIDIERVNGAVTVTIFCGRPGVVMGQEGANLKALKAGLLKEVGLSDIKIALVDIKIPDLDAKIVARNMDNQLEARSSSRIVQKRAIQAMMRAGALGCKTMIKGRVNGAEIARSEQYREGVLSLHTLSQNIDYAHVEARTTYGRLGCKVWIALPDKEKLESLSKSQERGAHGARRPQKSGERRQKSAPASKKGE